MGDARALLVSLWASAAFAVLALVWGLLAGSRLILFDGLYSFASVGLSLLAVLALRTARRGPDERYPWGREAWEPLTVVLKAAAMAALCVYALVGAVLEIIDGPTPVAVGSAFVYGLVSTFGGLAVTLVLRRARGSDLVRAEAAEWWGDTLLSVGVLAGFGLAWGLEAAGRSDLAVYVDPAMVIVVSAAFLPVPARLGVAAVREILSMAPPPELAARIREVVDDVARERGFGESFVRASKVGGRLDLEIDFVVPEELAVRECDEARADLQGRLAAVEPPVSMTVGFTAQREWVA